MKKQYIASVIGEEYKEWDSSKPISIHAPMGSGKTYFVLNILLPYVHSKKKKMVYLVNRLALKKQIEYNIPDECRQSITVHNYQQLACFYPIQRKREQRRREMILDREVEEKAQEMDEIASADYYILDEAHYFLADSLFNTKVRDCFQVLEDFIRRDRIFIFMTGTIDYLSIQLCWPKQIYKLSFPFPYGIQYFHEDVKIDIPLLSCPLNYPWEHICNVKSLLKYKETEGWIIERLKGSRFPISLYEYPTYYAELDLYLKSRLNIQSGQLSCFQYEYFQRVFKEIKNILRQSTENNCHFYTLPHDFSYIIPIFFDD